MAQMLIPLAISAAFQVLSLLLMPKPKVDKPTLPDQSYGTPIVRGWGRFVANATYIWGYTSRAGGGGKGALGGSQPKFNGTFGVLLCEGPIEDIRRIWWDGKLAYDKTPGFDPNAGDTTETELSSARFEQHMRIYRGTATQNPDPDYQDREGIDEVPGLRGFATLFFVGMPLPDGRIPYSVKVEVVERTATMYLSDILLDICKQAQYPATDIDVSDVDDVQVRGFFRSPEPPIETIKRLQIAYQFDVVDINGKVTFLKQSRTGAYGISRTDLGSYEYGGDPPELFKHVLINENEKIHEARLKYANYYKEYEEGEVYDRRTAINPQNVNKQDFETNLTLIPEEARAMAARLLYLAQLRSDQFSFSLPLHYFRYFPNDVLYGELYKGKFSAIQITKKKLGFNGLIDFEGILYGTIPYYQCHPTGNYVPNFQLPLPAQPTDNPIFGYTTPGQLVNPPSSNIPHSGESLSNLLDIPLIRDSDAEAGLYAISAGTYSWRGGNLYLANNADILSYYQLADQLTESSTWGYCSGILGAASPFLLDYANQLTVTLESRNTSLTNITLNQMLAGDNTAVIWKAQDQYEIIRFQNAQLIGNQTYRLSTLQRGIRGTEWGISLHTSGETFYLMREHGYYERVTGTVSNIGNTLLYRVPAFDQTLDEAEADSIVPKGYDLYPYAPVNIRGERNEDGDVTIQWVRRDRKAGDLPFFSLKPMSEAFERFVIQILNGSTVVREVLVSDVTEYVYGSTDQVTDFGGLQSSIKVKIYQVSGTVGRGFSGEATI